MQTAESVSLHPVLLDYLDQLLPNGYEITHGTDVQPPLPPDLMEITFGLPDEPYDAPPQVHGEMAALLWFIWFCHQITYKMDVDPHQVVRQQVTQWRQPTQDQSEVEPELELIHTITLMDRLEEF